MFASLSASQEKILVTIIVSTLFFGFGGGGMWLTGRWLLRNKLRRRSWMSSVGKVMDVSVSGSVGSSKFYFPIIAYEWQGREYSFKPSISFSRGNCQIGKEIPILVNPEKSDEAVADYFSHLYFWPAALFVFTSIFFFTAIAALWDGFHTSK